MRNLDTKNPEPPRTPVVLDGPEIDALGRYHRREATRLTKAGRTDEAAHHARRADDMLAARIMSGLEQQEPPPAYTLSAEGRDQHGRIWAPVECGPGLRLVPMTSPQCLAVWRAYVFEASRARAAGDEPRLEFCERLAAEFMRMANGIEPVLSEVAVNPPSYDQGGWA